MDNVDKLFIESEGFPVGDVNEASAREKLGGGRPPFWEMVFWWTRKPLAGARAVIAGALLSKDISPYEFKYHLRFADNTPHRKNPVIPPSWREIFRRARLLDPFAGFGSIPLEAVRLGVGEVVAVELLPAAYVFLKAVLEHPRWAVDRGLGRRLADDVERWGGYVVEMLRSDRDVGELYDDDIAVYIGSWEVRCPHCGMWTPLVGNWWLARVSRGGGEGEEGEEGGRGVYQRLAWMEPERYGGEVYIKIVDLNRELGKKTLTARVNTSQGLVEAEGRQYRVPRPNIDARRETATCLICNNQIMRTPRGEWHVKEALRDWNQRLEQYLAGQINLDTLLREAKARPRILAKVRIANGELEFQPASKQDTEKLLKALEKLKQIWGDLDIPTEELWKYTMGTAGALSIWTWGFDKFYKLFNPRQLLTLVKLTKLIREAGKKIEEEKLREGWSREDAHKYAEAITTYLAIALCKHADYSSLIAGWNQSLIMGHSLSMRGLAMMWNWYESIPWISWTGAYYRNIDIVAEGLSYLVSAVSGSSSRVRVLLDDASALSSLGGERFDLIVTDPPYRDDVAYAELSDFYYVWLKRALSGVDAVAGVPTLVPRFYPEAFFRDGVEVETQWRVFAPREVSESDGRARYLGVGDGFTHFKGLLNSAFKTMADRLADNGVLVTYYAHTSPEAWEALLEAGWVVAGLRVTASYSVITESAQRVTARGKASLDTSIIAVWRRGSSGEALADEIYARAVEACSGYADRVRRAGYMGVDLFVAVLGCVLSQFTQYRSIVGVGDLRRGGLERLIKQYIYPATAEAIARSLGAYSVGVRLGSASLFYLLVKVLVERRPRAIRRSIDRSSAIIFSIGTKNEPEYLQNLNIIKRDGDRFTLLEPGFISDLKASLEETLVERGIKISSPGVRSAIDALHILEYLAITLPRDMLMRRYSELRSSHPSVVEEAMALARILYDVLPSEDPEKRAIDILIRSLGIETQRGLDQFSKR